ncbi:MAG TPA: tail fiber protein [Gemmatimonadaceae bacterium]|nr:tail fiber protein [Gemmatimonadaceae bacterium]
MSDQFLGEIRMISWNFAPKYWAFCDGQTMAINQNQALFALLGTTYGGNGVATFQLPDLRSRTPMGWSTRVSPNTLGQVAGTESHTLSVQEIPVHTHIFNGTKTNGTSNQPVANGWVGAYPTGFGAAPTKLDNQTTMEPSTIGSAGGNVAHENRQPFLCIPYVIALSGVFPSRN